MNRNNMGWLRHLLIILSLLHFIVGCFVLGYIAWVLASSVTVERFLNGSMVFSYVTIVVGFTYFFTGLIGWLGGASENIYIVQFFLTTLIVSVLFEIGGLLSCHILTVQHGLHILETTWHEINSVTQNLIQRNLQCCGWSGPSEFAYNRRTIDESCYEELTYRNSGIPSSISTIPLSSKKMRSEGCDVKIFQWLNDYKVNWVTGLGGFFALQILLIGISLTLVLRVKRLKKFSKYSSISKIEHSDFSTLSSRNSSPTF